jgi:hypothetical protein
MVVRAANPTGRKWQKTGGKEAESGVKKGTPKEFPKKQKPLSKQGLPQTNLACQLS